MPREVRVRQQDLKEREISGFIKTLIVEFLEVFLHQTAFLKQVYPDSIYCTRRKYSIPVMMSEHPLVNQYIRTVTETFRANLSHLNTVEVVFSRAGPLCQKVRLEFLKIKSLKSSCSFDLKETLELTFASLLLRLAEIMKEQRRKEKGEVEWKVVTRAGQRKKGERPAVAFNKPFKRTVPLL